MSGSSPAENSRSGLGEPPDTGGDGTADAAARPEAPRVATVVGEITWLLSQSAFHRHTLFLADIEWLVVPAVRHGQFRVYRSRGQPVGTALWAFVGGAVRWRLEAGGRIAASEWRSGDAPWLVELVAPFGQAEVMLRELRASALAGRRLSFSRLREDGQRETVTLDPEPAPAAEDAPRAGDDDSERG